MSRKFANRATSTLVNLISSSSSSLIVQSGDGGKFPAVTGGVEFFTLVLQNATNFEIIRVYEHAALSTTLSGIIRGAESTTAVEWVASSKIGLRVTAEALTAFSVMEANLNVHQAHPHPSRANLLLTDGSGAEYSITPTPAITSYLAGMSFFIQFHATCGDGPRLLISAQAGQPFLVKQVTDGSYVNLVAGDILINHRSRVSLITSSQALVETLRPGVTFADRFAIGTRLAFNQAAAPVGWVKVTSGVNDDAAIRIVTGTGGGIGGSYALSGGVTTVAAHTHWSSLTSDVDTPGHTHTANTSENSHSHTVMSTADTDTDGGRGLGGDGFFADNVIIVGGGGSNHTSINAHSHSLSTSPGAHSHIVTGSTSAQSNVENWVPKYNDFIICSKS